MELTKPRIFKLKIMPKKEGEGPASNKIKKSTLPDCGSYEDVKAYKKTQLNGIEQKFFIEKSPRQSFLDVA